ncbi:hypothetical protein DFQ30_010840 [Apophysomyces sp. BC1015]|nr:hypothetical protein DFQ30_010840 [Apophysomyces sp. BC1015]
MSNILTCCCRADAKSPDDDDNDDDDFQPVIPSKRKRKHPSDTLGRVYKCLTHGFTDAVDHPVVLRPEITASMPATSTESSDPSTGPKTRKQKKIELASTKRDAKYAARSEAQKQKGKGKVVIYATCGQEGHSRASNKQYEKHKTRRKTACALKRTSVIKISLENTCKDPDFVYSIRFAVKHVHDVSYAGSLFANYYMLWLLKLGKELPIISHGLCYDMFATIAETGNSDELLKTVLKQFKDDIQIFDPENFASRGCMTLISDAAKQYEEAYLLIRFSDAKDEYYLGKIAVAERKAVAQHV